MHLPADDPLVVAPTPTPFRTDGSVDYDAIAHNAERWLDTPLSGFVLGSATGEELALSEDEKLRIVETVAAVIDGERLLIGGIDAPSVSETLRLATAYAQAGASLVRVRFPRGFPPDAIESYFRDVTAASPVPVVVIHQTFAGGPAAPPEVIGAVCGLDNVFGYITDHDIRYEGYVRPQVPRDRRFWICNGGLLAYGALVGANGACMWLGNIAPALCMDIMRAGHDGDFAEARRLQTTASALDHSLGRFGIAGIKAALAAQGYRMSGPRAPRPDISAAERAQVEGIVRGARLVR